MFEYLLQIIIYLLKNKIASNPETVSITLKKDYDIDVPEDFVLWLVNLALWLIESDKLSLKEIKKLIPSKILNLTPENIKELTPEEIKSLNLDKILNNIQNPPKIKQKIR